MGMDALVQPKPIPPSAEFFSSTVINEAAEKADNPEFTVAALTQHMRELDAPFEHYTTG